MPRIERKHLLERFRAMIARKEPIVGAGAGTGLSAKCEEAGGADMIIIYNSGRYRMAGRGSLAGLLAYGNANEIVKDMPREVLPVVRRAPVLAGVSGTNPFLLTDPFLDDLKALGFFGIQNSPTVGLIDGMFRKNPEETGMGYGLEVNLIAWAYQKDLLTTPYVFNMDEAALMTEAGADIIVAHLGLTTGGCIGAETALKLEDCPNSSMNGQRPRARCARTSSSCHGGPISSPEDAAYILKTVPAINGFYGASSMERLPVEPCLPSRSAPTRELCSDVRHMTTHDQFLRENER